MLTDEYNKLILNNQISGNYRKSIKLLVDNILPDTNLYSFIIYGGIVRDGFTLAKWSDIDIMLVYANICSVNKIKISEIVLNIRALYSIRLDLTILSLRELENNQLFQFFYNGEILNILANRDGVAKVLYGQMPKVSFSLQQEKQAAIYYINSTHHNFRRYLIEVAYDYSSSTRLEEKLGRLIRWTFSIVRASLRLFDIYSHPYEFSLQHVTRLFPALNINILMKLIAIRNDMSTLNNITFEDICLELDFFIEEYVTMIMCRYNYV